MRLALAWTGLLLASLFAPADWIGSPPSGVAFSCHVVLFGVSAMLWGRALPERRGLVFVALIALAVATELGQGLAWVERRVQPRDLVANALGLALGGWVLTRSPRAPSSP